MAEQRAYLKIREGAFFYLAAADPDACVEQRGGGAFEPVDDGRPLHVAWYASGAGRVPVYRLGALLGSVEGEWESAVVLASGPQALAIAAGQVQPLAAGDTPAVQAFNPAGSRFPGVITGVCPDTRPEHLVLDLARLTHRLHRAAAEGRVR